MKVKTVQPFIDILNNKLRGVGDVFDVTKKRYHELNNTIHGVVVVETKTTNKKEID